MGEIAQHVLWARVAYQPLAAQAALAGLAMAPETQGPGLNAGDAVQVAVYLATLRDVVASYDPISGGPVATIAVYTKDGAPVCLYETSADGAVALSQKMSAVGNYGIYVVGGAPLRNTGPTGPVPKWGKKLALALDEVLAKIGSAEQGPTQPVGFVNTLNVVLPALAPLAVIVTGAALSVIGVVAVWRYLDPDFRRDALLVKQAAVDYAGRLQIFKDTGAMPPPSQNEVSATSTVEAMAKSRSGTEWMWGAGIAGGVTLVALASAVIGNGK